MIEVGDRWPTWYPRVWDSVLFVVGVAGIINELFLLPQPRPVALAFLASLVGFPFAFLADTRRRKRHEDNDE